MIVAVSSKMVAGSLRIQGSLQGLQGSPVAGYWELSQDPLGSLRIIVGYPQGSQSRSSSR